MPKAKTPKTLHDKLVASLLLRGCELSPNPHGGKATRMTRPALAGTFYFVGKSGSLRFGRNYTDSIPASESFKTKLLLLANILSRSPISS